MTRDKDTVCALATAHGIGAISVVRISGSKAVEITRKLAAFLPENLESHKIYYGILKSVEGEALDEVLVSYFANGRSFTGETSFEISCHGSEAVVNQILENLILAGARAAERGEFTYRAFMNGRMDLVQAESVLALIESRSKRASSMALRQLQGDLSKHLRALSERVTWVLAQLEANIDFASEDIEIATASLLTEKTGELLFEVENLLATYKQGRLIQNGFQVLLTGRPNAGKSSVLNALVQSEKAIVTPIAGTTRDFVEAELQIEGVRVTLVDSAGLRVTDDTVEKIGVERALSRMEEADLVFYLFDAGTGLTDEDRTFFDNLPWSKTIFVANKSDLNHVSESPITGVELLRVSALSSPGVVAIRETLSRLLRRELSEDSTVISQARHFHGLKALRESLQTVLPLFAAGESPDLIALELQAGLQALYEILGLTYDDQVMDRVFSEFCLGK